MRLSSDGVAPAPMPGRALWRIAAAGALCAAAVVAAGWLIQRALLGADEQEARARVEREVRLAFDRIGARLRAVAAAVDQPAQVFAAADEDAAATRQLFAAAAAAVGAADDASADLAVTVFAPDGRPLAWAGRPSEIARDRLSGGEAWYFSSATLGPRVVHLAPVLDGDVRIGIIAAEHPIGPAVRLSGPGAAPAAASTFPTRLAPVTIRPPVPAADAGQAFTVEAPSGQPLAVAAVAGADLRATRDRWRRTTWSLAILVLAVTAVLLVGPLLDWRNQARRASTYTAAVLLAAGAVMLARLLARAASPADWSNAPLFSGVDYAGTLFRPLLTSPFDFLLSAAMAGGLVGLLLFAGEAWRLRGWRRRRRADGPGGRGWYVLTQLAAGLAVAFVLTGHHALLQNTIANSTLDLLHFSLQRWNVSRLALQVGLILAHATALALAVAVLRAATARWIVRRGDWRLRVVTMGAWLLPLLVWRLTQEPGARAVLPLLIAAVAAVGLARATPRLLARYRHGTQVDRLALLTLGLLVPAFAFYPTLFQLAWQAKAQLVETYYAPQVINQRQTVLELLQDSRAPIDAIPDLAQLVSAPLAPDEAMTDRAYRVWQATALSYPVTSSVELFGPDGTLVSRFAFNLPEDLAGTPTADERTCEWEIYGETAPFFAEERTTLHAGRAVCDAAGRPRGSIVLHAMPEDYENLPFIASRSPYVELLRPADPLRGEGLSERDVEYAVYGWSRTPLYASGDTAWPLPDAVFAQLEQSRAPVWAEVRRGSTEFDVYLLNDRGGIYALGFPIVSALDHLVHLAELTVLAVLAYLLLLAGNAVFGWLSRRGTTAPALLREIRASFYRKLFIAFVAAVAVPVASLAVVTRIYVAERIRTGIEDEAVRTAQAAARVIEDLVAPRAAVDGGVTVDDNPMVWVSRLIDQDVNLFAGGRLAATSERNLFASGFLPMRTPAEIHVALTLRREAATVIRERIGTLNPYLLAGVPLFDDAVLTVPLTARQLEIEREIETLDRRVLLAALLFMLVGAGLGYTMAERIADPVNRLTRATRRIARGDLDARVAATSSDELRRLVDDFNSMARDLRRQRGELERTNRLEAWAEMARQVAHEIKNPLTPIQLNAEHLRRVHADRGEPLGSVLADCTGTILSQVKLLRQIASEFSSFASSPTARPAAVDVAELLREVVDPYRAGLEPRIRFDVDVPATLPSVRVDRTLIARSLTNIVENALHAMPGEGTLGVLARAENAHVRVRVSDTGGGMDAEALARAFEPYFSTKATGTGLGLPIAKRNVELSGGTIAVSSERDRGTTVDLLLPLAE